MGILSNTVSICQLKVEGDRPDLDLFDWASDRLSKFGFIPIDNVPEEESVGWVHVDNHNETAFLAPGDFYRDHLITMALRKDQRKIPKVLVKGKMEKAEKEFLEANPGYKRVPKEKKEELMEAVISSLLSKTLPSPSTYDAVWDTKSNVITFTSLSDKVIEMFREQFRITFEGLNVSTIHPFARADMILDEEMKPALAESNQASGEDVLSQVAENRWIGCDFLLWLMYQTMNESSLYKVNVPGIFEHGEQFSAFLNDRLILLGDSDNGAQKVTVVGPQGDFNEVKTALQDKKQIIEATIFFDMDEDSWKMTLKGDRFYFGSFKSPSVKAENDDVAENISEKEAVFYEKMFVQEKGIQLFDSLYKTFLFERLSTNWDEKRKKIDEWQGVRG